MKQLEIEYAFFDLRGIINSIGSLLSFQMELKELKYSCEIDEKIPAEICSDPNRIQQVLYNLMENAIKYNKKGGTVKVRVMRVEFNNSDAIEMSVEDTGKGIDLARLNNLFSLEEIVNDQPSCRRISVSLPIAYEICKKLGGELRVQTQIDIGSVFSFIIVSKEIKMVHHRNCAPKMIPLNEESSDSMNEEEEKEWNVQEDELRTPIIHKPILTKDLHLITTSIHNRGRSDDNISIQEKMVVGKEKDLRSMSLAISNTPNMERRRRAKRIKKAYTSGTPLLNASKLTLRKAMAGQIMEKELLKIVSTPKRSFSSEDVNGNKQKDTKELKTEIAKIKQLRALLRQTIRKDPRTLRNNVIKCKSQMFSVIDKGFPMKKEKSNIHTEIAITTKVKNIQHELLNFHLDHDISKSFKVQTSTSKFGSLTFIETELVSRFEKEKETTDTVHSKTKVAKKSPSSRRLCIVYIASCSE